MGLDSVIEGSQENKLRDKHLCPSCGKEGTETEHYYWRCDNDCDVITYYPTERSSRTDYDNL